MKITIPITLLFFAFNTLVPRIGAWNSFAQLTLKSANNHFGNGESLKVTGTQCNSGIYFNTPEKFSCFCLTGVWAFYSAWCTVPVSIVAGINYCQEFLKDTQLTQGSLLSSNLDVNSPTLARVTANMYQLREIAYPDSKVDWNTKDSSFISSGTGISGWTIKTTNGDSFCLLHNTNKNITTQKSTPSYCLFDVIGDYTINYTRLGCNSFVEKIEPVYCKQFLMSSLQERSKCLNQSELKDNITAGSRKLLQDFMQKMSSLEETLMQEIARVEASLLHKLVELEESPILDNNSIDLALELKRRKRRNTESNLEQVETATPDDSDLVEILKPDSSESIERRSPEENEHGKSLPQTRTTEKFVETTTIIPVNNNSIGLELRRRKRESDLKEGFSDSADSVLADDVEIETLMPMPDNSDLVEILKPSDSSESVEQSLLQLPQGRNLIEERETITRISSTTEKMEATLMQLPVNNSIDDPVELARRKRGNAETNSETTTPDNSDLVEILKPSDSSESVEQSLLPEGRNLLESIIRTTTEKLEPTIRPSASTEKMEASLTPVNNSIDDPELTRRKRKNTEVFSPSNSLLVETIMPESSEFVEILKPDSSESEPMENMMPKGRNLVSAVESKIPSIKTKTTEEINKLKNLIKLELNRLKRKDVKRQFEKYKFGKTGYLVQNADDDGAGDIAKIPDVNQNEEGELSLKLDEFNVPIDPESQRARNQEQGQIMADENSPMDNIPEHHYDLPDENGNGKQVDLSQDSDLSLPGSLNPFTDATLDLYSPDSKPYTGGPGNVNDSPLNRGGGGKTEMPQEYNSPDSRPYTGDPGQGANENRIRNDNLDAYHTPDTKPYTGPGPENRMLETGTESYFELSYSGQDYESSNSRFGSRSGSGNPNDDESEDDDGEPCLNNIHEVKNNPLILSHLGSHVELKIASIVGTIKNKVDNRRKWPAVRILMQILEIMKKTCNSVSIEYLDMVMDTFINLQIHSLHIKEPFIPHPIFYRIEKSLEKCYKLAVPHTFVTDEVSRKPIGTTCENGVGTGWATKSGPLKPSSNKILRHGKVTPLDMPEDRRGKGFEPVIETAWKVLVNAHSYCYKHFNDYFMDHHAFTVSLMPFFNNDVQSIWMPPRLNGTYVEPNENEYLYGGLIGDHNSILNDIDNCVGASRIGSAYPWHMSRPPKDEFNRWRRRRKRRSIENSPGAATADNNQFCLNSPDDPINLLAMQKCER